MRICCVTSALSVSIVELDDAPPHLEAVDEPRFVGSRTRIFERRTSTADPVNGIVLYEELPR